MVEPLQWDVLNATADDGESLDQSHPAICEHFARVRREAVAEAVARLLAVGLLVQRPVTAALGEAWFQMTEAGWETWQAAAPDYGGSPR